MFSPTISGYSLILYLKVSPARDICFKTVLLVSTSDKSSKSFINICISAFLFAHSNYCLSMFAPVHAFFLKLHTFCYFQLLYPFVWKHPEHILLPFVNQHDQEVFEQRRGLLIWRQLWQQFFGAYRNLYLWEL